MSNKVRTYNVQFFCDVYTYQLSNNASRIIKIAAHSKFEAFVIFMKSHLDQILYYPAGNFGIIPVLQYYYQLDQKCIDIVNNIIGYNDILYNWNNGYLKNRIILYYSSLPYGSSAQNAELKKFHLNTMPILDRIKSLDIKFLKFCYTKNLVKINITEINEQVKTTLICIWRITKKVANNNYKHIWRLVNIS